MKSLKYIFFFLLILIIGTAIYISVQPNNYEVTRSRTINVAPPVVYNNVIDFKNWEDWSSWKEKDPTTTFSYSDQTAEIGGSFSWVDKNGTGKMKVLSATPNVSIEQEMQFDDFEPSKVNWTFEPSENNSTKVVWKMASDKVPFMLKAYAAFSGGFDKMIGPDFERGLEKLDSIVVESTKKYSVEINGTTEYGGGFHLYKTTSASAANISELMGQQYGHLVSYMTNKQILPSGGPFTIYLENDLENGNVIMSNAIPVKEKITIEGDNQILCGYIPKTKALKATFKGNYNNLGIAWEEVHTYIERNNIVINDAIKPFEVYANDPGQYPNPADWLTEIYIPIKE